MLNSISFIISFSVSNIRQKFLGKICVDTVEYQLDISQAPSDMPQARMTYAALLLEWQISEYYLSGKMNEYQQYCKC